MALPGNSFGFVASMPGGTWAGPPGPLVLALVGLALFAFRLALSFSFSFGSSFFASFLSIFSSIVYRVCELDPHVSIVALGKLPSLFGPMRPSVQRRSAPLLFFLLWALPRAFSRTLPRALVSSSCLRWWARNPCWSWTFWSRLWNHLRPRRWLFLLLLPLLRFHPTRWLDWGGCLWGSHWSSLPFGRHLRLRGFSEGPHPLSWRCHPGWLSRTSCRATPILAPLLHIVLQLFQLQGLLRSIGPFHVRRQACTGRRDELLVCGHLPPFGERALQRLHPLH